MLIESITAHHFSVTADKMDGVFDLDAWKGFMLSITAKPIDGANQPLAGVENVRKCVLDGTSSLAVICIVSIPIGRAIEREMLAADGDNL